MLVSRGNSILSKERKAHVEYQGYRLLDLNLDGSGKTEIDTGIGFFDHMLNSFARHGFFDLSCRVKGDLHVDCHHTIEDTGIVLGQAIRESHGRQKRESAAMASSLPSHG